MTTLKPPQSEQQAIATLAARVDLLRVQRSHHVAVFLENRGHYGTDDSVDRQWRTSLTTLDQRVREFLEGHPDLHPASRQRLLRSVTGPLQALGAVSEHE